MNDKCRNEAGKKDRCIRFRGGRIAEGEECTSVTHTEMVKLEKKRQIRCMGGRKTGDECMSGNTQMGIFCYN